MEREVRGSSMTKNYLLKRRGRIAEPSTPEPPTPPHPDLVILSAL